MLMNLWTGYWGNDLEGMDMRVEYVDKTVIYSISMKIEVALNA